MTKLSTNTRSDTRKEDKAIVFVKRAILVLAIFVLVSNNIRLIFQVPFSFSESESDLNLDLPWDIRGDTTPERPFLDFAMEAGTDKALGYAHMEPCADKGVVRKKDVCHYPDDERHSCRVWGHFYDTMYDRWLEPYTSTNSGPAQILEIGFSYGDSFAAYTQYLAPNENAELHSMDIACKIRGKKSSMYQQLIDDEKLHCGDASDYEFLKNIWTNKMKRNGEGPPLKVVIDDGSHMAEHIATSLFFWLPRIEPGGIFVVEDIQPVDFIDKFRTHIIPQVMKDLHWCGGPRLADSLCFPTIQPFIHGVHCEMHICVFVRNEKPAVEPSREDSLTPADAFSGAAKCLFGPHDVK